MDGWEPTASGAGLFHAHFDDPLGAAVELLMANFLYRCGV